MFVALAIPEVVVYLAWCQWSAAKTLSTEVNNLLDQGKALKASVFIN
jgi:hypothetical protein